ncbi:MAG: MotA/TolQ/ExbB proton channel family protein [Planctomycetes bacterium]|nr:MotA/TolQ/ExbB proton channel family protein [Planctomycetota bacterium]
MPGEIVGRGGVVVYAIFGASVIALGVFIERMVYFVKTREPADKLLGEAIARIRESGPAEAREYLEAEGSGPFSRFLGAGLGAGLTAEERRTALQDAGKRESFLYRRYLRALSAVAQVSPLLGLLGTVLGMIDAFKTLEETTAGMMNPADLSQGIWKALVTTAFGLGVAIPAYIGYHVGASLAEKRIVEMEVAGDRLMEEIGRTKLEED